MRSEIKVLALAVFAITTMTMAATAPAQASELHVTNQQSAAITGQQTESHKFIISGTTVSCSQATFEGKVVDTGGSGAGQITEQELTLTPTYLGCQAYGEAAQIKMNGCKYTVTNKLSGVKESGFVYVDITGCTTGKRIEVVASGCTVTVFEQHNLSKVRLENVPGQLHHVITEAGLSGLAYELHGAVCKHPTTIVTNDGSYSGRATFKAFKSHGSQQVTRHGHQYQEELHGNEQVGLLATPALVPEGAVLTAEQIEKHLFTTSAGTVQCSTLTFEGTVSGDPAEITANSATLTATGSGCQAFGLAAQVRLNGCKYIVTGGQPEPLTALVDISGCTAGKQIEVNAGFGGCIATVPEQSGLSHITFANKAGPPEDVEAQLTISSIKYELHGGLCGHPTTVTTSNGSYAGKATARVYEDAGAEATTQHGHQFWRSKHNSEQLELGVANSELHVGEREKGEGAVFTAEQLAQNLLTTSAGTVACSTAAFEGTVTGDPSKITAESVTLTATYSGCQAFGLAAQVRMNGCKYVVTGGQPEPLTALVDISGCTAGKQIEVNAGFGGCIATVPEQSGLSHITFKNKAGLPEDVEVQSAVLGIKYELHGALCGHEVTKTTSNGIYTGTATARAYVDEGTQQVTQHSHQFSRLLDGEQLALHAADGELHAGEEEQEEESAVITGAQSTQHVFTISAGTVKCTNVQLEGTVSGEPGQITAGHVTITPTYSGCQGFGLAATVQMNGCKYTITGGQAELLTALVDIVGCTEGKKVTVNAGFGGCVATVGEQSGLSHVTFTNVAGSPDHITDSATITGISYELHGGLCGHPTTVATTNGSYSGSTTLKAYEDTGNHQATEHSHEFAKSTHNSTQLDLGAGGGELHVGG
jgi:hypothetical protein